MTNTMFFLTAATEDTARQFDLPGDDPEVYTNDPNAPKSTPDLSPASPPAEEQPTAPTLVPEATAETETVSTLEVTEEQEPAPDPMPLWIGLGVLAGILIGAVAALVLKKLLKKKPAAAVSYPTTAELPVSGNAAPQISKLHEQGTRSSQQDSFAISPPELISTKGTLAVVCDGMGGLEDGDKVSQTAVSAMLNHFLELQGEPDRLLLASLAGANRAVNYLLGPADLRRSGSTMVAGILKDNRFSYLSVGDSRICLYRAGQLVQLNREHIHLNELSVHAINDQMSFRDVWSHPKPGALTSYLGMGELKYVDIPAESLQVLAGDKLILMSDGVYNALTTEELSAALALPSGEDTATMRKAIEAKQFEHQDNYTAVVLTVPAT